MFSTFYTFFTPVGSRHVVNINFDTAWLILTAVTTQLKKKTTNDDIRVWS